MEEERKDVGSDKKETTEKSGTAEVTEKKTLMELINSDKELQSQFDKAKADSINTAINNAKAKWEAEQNAKNAEAEKLAKMDEDQKRNYELEQWKARAERAEKENSISNLKSETLKQASEKGIPLEFINFNFEYENAETINNKLDSLLKALNKQREIVISEFTKEIPPKTGDDPKVDKTQLKSYEDWAKYLKDKKEN